MPPSPSRLPAVRLLQLVGSCVVLGAGIVLLLRASLGSDGYSTLISGLALATGVEFAAVNVVVGALLVGLAWMRGTRPGLGTVVQPVLVGVVVSLGLRVVDTPSSLPARAVLLVVAIGVVALGVAGYLGSATGAGPAEAAALAVDPPVPFRWGYSAFQVLAALVGWACGATVGVGTLVVVLVIGPLVDLAGRALPRLVHTPT